MKHSTNWKIIKDPKKAGGQGYIRIVANLIDPKIKGALKTIHPNQQKKRIKRDRMCREIDSLSKIMGNGIPKIYEHNIVDLDDFDTPLYFITEWVNGNTIHEKYYQKPTTLNEAIRLTRELSLIVDRCHQEDILHRDIKPQNILIDDSGKLFLIDFGLAWIKPSIEKEPRFNSLLHEEISNYFLRLPEYITGYEKHNKVSDITSLVGVLFFLVTGQYPKSLTDGEGNPPHITLKQYFTSNLVSDKRFSKLKRIFNIGFQPSIKHRFQSAIDLIKMLDEINQTDELNNETIKNNPQVLKLQEILNSTTFKTKKNIFNMFSEINNELHKKLSEYAKESNLTAGTNFPESDTFRSVNINFGNINYSKEKVRLNHKLELIDRDGTKFRATYTIDNNFPELYYSGYSSDIEGLRKALENKVYDIFIKIAEAYTTKTRRPPSLL